MAIRIGWTTDNGVLDGDQSRSDMHQPLSRSSVMTIDAILLESARGYLSETQRAVRLTSDLINSGAHLPASIDFTSILMTDHGLWYLQCICPTLDVTEVENLSLPSQWIFACLVRTVRACYESVSRQLQGFPVKKLQRYTSTQRLVGEINSSQAYLRHRFLLSISVGGCAFILEDLLFHGLSIGDFPTQYLEMAAVRGRVDVARVLLNHGAWLSLESSTQLLRHTKPGLKTFLRDPNKSGTFCYLLTRILASYGPLHEIDAEHALFDSLVPIFEEVLLLSVEVQTSSTLNCDIIQLFLRYSGSSSPDTSTRLLQYMEARLPIFIRDQNKSETFCHFLAQILESCGPLQEIDDRHPLFESLVHIFQTALFVSNEEQSSSISNSEDCICNRVLWLLLKAGLFRDSKLPARYWSFYDTLRRSNMSDSPMTLAIYMCNVYTIKLLLENGSDVDETHPDRPSRYVECRCTPLTYAILLGFIDAVTVLLAAGADVTKMGAHGQTAAVFAGICVSLPVSTIHMGFVQDTGSDRCEDGTASRRQIFAMVCADLETRHGMKYEKFVNRLEVYCLQDSRLQSAGIRAAHPDIAEYGLMRCRSSRTILSLLGTRQLHLCLLSPGDGGFILGIHLG